MTRFHLLSIAALATGLIMAISITGIGDAYGARGSRGSVTCKLKVKGGKRVAICPKGQLRGARGARGPRGAVGPVGAAGPAGAAAGSGSGLNLNFNAYLVASERKELTIGNFTIRAASDALGSCVPILLRIGGTDSQVSVGSGASFATALNNTSKELAKPNTSNMFTAVSENGQSTMSGIVGAVTAGSVCLVSGYVTGH